MPMLSSYAVNHEKTGFAAVTALLDMIDDKWTAQRASFEVPRPDVSERASSLDERGSARLAQTACTFIRAQPDKGIAPSINDVT